MSSKTRVSALKGINTRKPLVLALCLMSWSIAPAAQADDAVLPTVTVTASPPGALAPTSGYAARTSQAANKTDTPLAEIDQSVSVITRQQIEDQSPRTLSQALNYTPGVYSASIGSSTRYDYIVLRGFNGHVNLNEWLDGLRLLGDAEGNNAPQIDPWAVERIDVVRGPDSVFYGQSSPGGLVALTGKRPLDTPLHQVEVGFDSDRQRWLGLDLTGPLADRPDLSYRLLAKGLSGGTQQTFASTERYLLAPSLAWRIDSRNRLLLQAYLQNDPATGYHGSVPYAGSATAYNGRTLPVSFDDGSPSDGMRRQQQLFGYQFEHDIDDNWQLRQNLRYQKSRTHSQQVYQTGWNGGLLQRAAVNSQENGDGYAVDNQLSGRFTTGMLQHTLLAGLDAYRMTNDGYNQYGTASSIDPFAPSYADEHIVFGAPGYFRHRVDQTGLYLNDTLALRQWRLNLGARRDHAEILNRDPIGGSQAQWNGDKVTRRAGLSYVADSGLTPYVSYSEGFDPSASYYKDSSGDILAPQQSKQKEAGVKFQPRNSQTLLSAALYDLRQENVAYFNAATNAYVPVGVVRSRGLELEAKTRVDKRLSLMASLTVNTMRIVEGANQGNTPFASPSRLASVWADYAFASGLGVGAGARYIGPQWVDSANTLRLPSVTLIDLSLRYDLGRLDGSLKGASARLSANNLFNRAYVASCYDSQTYCYDGNHRTLSALFGYQW